MRHPPRPAAFAVFAGSLLLSASGFSEREAFSGDKLPGEVEALTDKVRADAQKLVDTIVKGEGDMTVPRRALVRLGPVVWPVVENAMKLMPPDAAKPHFSLVKALLAPKSEPEFETLRARLRKRLLMDDWKGAYTELSTFRLGLPDPANKGKFLPHSVKPMVLGGLSTFRSSDGSIVLGYGADADEKKPDATETQVSDDNAGFVAAIGGKPLPFERQSGKGSDVSVTATNGFAWAWATDGAAGKSPGGSGGEAGVATATGGAGQFARTGDGGKSAPG
jgi:hypothetical protein